MATFRHVRIGDIGDIITGKTPKTSDITNYGADYMFIGPGDLHQNFIITKSVKRISKKGLESIKGCILHRLSIVVGCIGWDIGNVALIQEKCATNQQINSVTNVKEDFNTYYIYYWLKSKKKYLFQIANVTRTPILNKTDFSNIIINVPNKINQDRVAYFLKSLDTKIELNNRINRELEGMAKLLYDYWFVQFDFPISEEQAIAMGKPELKGKPYKSSGGPMMYNEQLKREIPEGWGVEKLGEIVNTKLGGTPSTKRKDYWERGEFNWLNSGEIANFPIIASELSITANAIKNSATKLMPKGTVALSITRHIRPSILAIDACANQSVIGIYETDTVKSSFLYPLIKNEVSRYMSLRTGAQQPHINKQTVDNTRILLPENGVLKSYYKVVDPLYNKIINNAFQNQQLINLRDWLLPMLMNGQVRVSSEAKKEYRNEGEVLMAAEGREGYE